ncbi:16S rRNA (guanine(966)-N(2))-methyltransferase RsmD [Clostridium beijerinckii]|uniref:16S rRNA (guanine(966)-N(2))-methyltransferase RsmD n=1 Tax=Clostridium beijerinckii TaxID=1520 RepID=UPI0013614D16|nr:16S rRNA (guanine(966)-N(2))-methyltransferase RsmD [Clostridium beijerinckii]MZK50736.1 16S rRNA (guanine(966)-N(2))-methyltransferase RsmD [Clostridium beijerinckii]MZK58940.1 16S rRNA (guanine(966)-N(2))-methyltransferase RsmD [Clostridium beijerinckii]MZK69059.1 16S rRNA (guanine(966)-N(2))-methyltransferase RsmD [Clostridium beijerinckii]MZK74431.1 16S rRNA (guanine(966)-N(2))-methyltransferase RsmD [Clostridium beijerinckii]MZK84131.1 16S rRNA (guanine(966)-N(2))-methyltransferase Rsm
MRIIAGKARGHKLIPPATMETRPTLDRVKEAMFSSIQMYIPEAVVVDVFAGTGSLGLEAASRGASEVYLFDKSSVTFPLLKENVESLKFQDFCFPMNIDAYEGLKNLAKKGKKFDIIFIDPPYCKEMIPEAMKIVKDNEILKNDGIIVTKIDTIEEIYEGYKDIKLTKSKKYGNTTVCYYKYEEK